MGRATTAPQTRWERAGVEARITHRLARALAADARHYQIAILAALLAYAVGVLGAPIAPATVLVAVTVALTTQAVATALLARRAGATTTSAPAFDFRSPLISALSLSLLLRTDTLVVVALGALVAIAGKFLIRVRGKHLFNPTNLAIVVLLLAVPEHAWVSPGQWGESTVVAFALACAGGLVLHRSERADITIAFLVAWTVIVIGRGLWLGDPLAVGAHRLTSGALLIFAFFMISDPRSTPDSRAGRIVLAVLVALGAALVEYGLWRRNGLFLSLAACSMLVPLIDRWLPGPRHHRRRPGPASPLTADRSPDR